MQKLGIVSPAVGLCCDTINICKYKELNLIRYTLCEVLNNRKTMKFLKERTKMDLFGEISVIKTDIELWLDIVKRNGNWPPEIKG
ncbi:hypothetical protein [Candidatus Nitrotoga sp. AM1P]|uniref:hypothetical protein n=1 Tax=Candidatus Nitrotoga sp. AM1P TaxID=2559597 RepID=UPI0015658537|nr:hypothetical protein [Candidatus Nitrotoga sp. AM1P]